VKSADTSEQCVIAALFESPGDLFLRFFETGVEMKTLILLVTIPIAIISTNGFGQSSTEGIKVGYNLAGVSGVTDYTDNQPISAFNVGVYTAFNFVGLFAIQPELLYAVKSYKLTYKFVLKDFGGPIAPVNTVIETGHNSYLEIPVLLKLNIPHSSLYLVKPSIFAGPEVAFQLTGKVNIERSLQPNDNEDVSNSTSTDFGIDFGAGTDVNLLNVVLMFDIRYDVGLKTLHFSQGPSSIKNRVFSLNIGLGI